MGRIGLLAIVAATLTGAVCPAFAQNSPETVRLASQVCAACHGERGNSTRPQTPTLAGQGAAYLEAQLHLFAAQGRHRASGVMGAMALQLTPAQMHDLAEYFSHQRLEPVAGQEARLAAKGESIWFEGIADSDVPACAACHGVRGQGLPSAFPRLAGQHAAYVQTQLREFRSGARASDPRALMRSVAAKLSDAEMQAVAQYVATLR